MTIDDIYTIDLTDDMILEARAEQEWLDKNKQGEKTRNVISDKNIIGSLAHQAVELAFQTSGYDFESTRKIKYKQGDTCDISYLGDSLDVKGTRGKLNEKWFYNRGFLVFQAQVDDPKFEEITHLLFAEVDLDGMQVNIYGVIERQEFLRKSRLIKAGESRLQYNNWEIKARQLTPLKKYIYKT